MIKLRDREALRKVAMEWVKSPSFDSYFHQIHVRRMHVGVAVMYSLMRPWKLSPVQAVRGVRRFGIASGDLRRRYYELAASGRVTIANTWMANSKLTLGNAPSAPASLISGSYGTDDGDAYVAYVTQQLARLTDRSPATNDERLIQEMLEDETFNLFRVRSLPTSFTSGCPVHLFDTMLHRTTADENDALRLAHTVCLTHPRLQPAILPLPALLVRQHLC